MPCNPPKASRSCIPTGDALRCNIATKMTEPVSLLLQWNIERGYKLSAVVAALKAIDADVVALQEVDIGCDRSGNEDTGACCACHEHQQLT